MKRTLVTCIMLLCAFLAQGQTHHLSFWPDVPFAKKETMIMPATFYVLTTKYVTGEVRFAFETEQSVSFYLGRTFVIKGKETEVSVTPSVGGIFDHTGYQAWSPQVTLFLKNPRWSIFSFSQPIYSNRDRWFFQWTEFAFPVSRLIDLELGIGWQIIVPNNPSTTVGVFARYTVQTKTGGIFLQVWPQYDPLRDRGSCLIGIGFFID
jgi:hypothetical protein